ALLDGHRLPRQRQHVLVAAPVPHLRREVLDGVHAVELADPVVPDLRDVGRRAGGDGGDELLPRLRLWHELHLHLEVLLRLVEALGERLHAGGGPRGARGVPRSARRHFAGLPPCMPCSMRPMSTSASRVGPPSAPLTAISGTSFTLCSPSSEVSCSAV